MPDTFTRNPGDQPSYGYKQLPGLGPGGGSELKTMVYAGIGIALGIVAGTFLAGSYHQGAPQAAAPVSVQASLKVPGPVNPPVTSAKLTPATQIHAEDQKVSPLPTHRQSSVVTKPAAAYVTPALRRHRSAHRLAISGRHRLRQRAHSKHRLRGGFKPPARRSFPEPTMAASLAPAPVPFVFMIEGYDTEANYEASSRMVETYEGTTYSFHRTPNEGQTALLQDFPTNIHYRCNQSGDCTLVLPTQAALPAQRMDR